MKLSPSDLQHLAELATLAAAEAGEMIARSRPLDVERKPGGASLASQVVTEIDRRSEDIIVEHLTPTLDRFELGLLTEERQDDGGRFVADYFWCIDPLDGTLPFIEGRPGYAISLALVGHDGVPWIGVVFDPVESSMIHVIRGVGAFRDGGEWTAKPSTSHVLSVFADTSFESMVDHDAVVENLRSLARLRGLEGIELAVGGGAVMNACGVLSKPPACYIKFPVSSGGGSLWDFAATACLFNEIGAVATDMAGRPLDLNRADDTLMGHRGVLFATDQRLADGLRALHERRR